MLQLKSLPIASSEANSKDMAILSVLNPPIPSTLHPPRRPSLFSGETDGGQLNSMGPELIKPCPSHPSRSVESLIGASREKCSTTWVSEVKNLCFVFPKKSENKSVFTLTWLPYKSFLFPSLVCLGG